MTQRISLRVVNFILLGTTAFEVVHAIFVTYQLFGVKQQELVK